MAAKKVRVPRLALLMAVAAASVIPALVYTSFAQGCAAPAVSGSGPAYPYPASAVAVPAEADWIDYGPLLATGPKGAWDDGIGMAPPMSTIVQRDGVFYLYYVGFDGVRALDGGERHRSVGVATSADGIHFTKYEGNPIITYRPSNNEEEAAGGVAATVADDGTILLYWGASDAGSPTSLSVDSDIRLSTSSDGFTFADQGDIIEHGNPAVWGYGDELFPLGVYEHGGTWRLYYIAKGLFGIFWDIGVAWGGDPKVLPQTRCAITREGGTNIFGGGSIAELAPDTYALFLVRNNPAPYMEVRTFAPQTPHLLSQPAATYNFANFWSASVTLDKARRTWLMYTLDSSASDDYFEWHINLKLAPFGPRDTSPPSAPPALAAEAGAPAGVALSWGAAEDADTGIVSYIIYRDGVKIGSTFDLQFQDSSPGASATAAYEVAAVNLHGVEGPRCGPVSVVQALPCSQSFMPIVKG
jgi:hypothetical protein